jgi:hypothetical protein
VNFVPELNGQNGLLVLLNVPKMTQHGLLGNKLAETINHVIMYRQGIVGNQIYVQIVCFFNLRRLLHTLLLLLFLLFLFLVSIPWCAHVLLHTSVSLGKFTHSDCRSFCPSLNTAISTDSGDCYCVENSLDEIAPVRTVCSVQCPRSVELCAGPTSSVRVR